MIKKEKYTVFDHRSRFDTEQKCLDYLVQLRWNGKPKCKFCENDFGNYFIKTTKRYKCKNCRRTFSILEGTIFEKSQIPLPVWLEAIFIVVRDKRGIPSCQLAVDLGVQQRTAWFMLQRIRECLVNEFNIILSGIVEGDESALGPEIKLDFRLSVQKKLHDAQQDLIFGKTKRKKKSERKTKGEAPAKRGRPLGTTKANKSERDAEKTKFKEEHGERTPFTKNNKVVFGLIERGGRIILRKIGPDMKSRTRENMYPILENHVDKDSIFLTDALNLYDDTKHIFKAHFRRNKKKKEAINEYVHTNNIENVWKHLNRLLYGTYIHISYHHTDGYLAEYSYRKNRRKASHKELFEEFMPLVIGKRLELKVLFERRETRKAA